MEVKHLSYFVIVVKIWPGQYLWITIIQPTMRSFPHCWSPNLILIYLCFGPGLFPSEKPHWGWWSLGRPKLEGWKSTYLGISSTMGWISPNLTFHLCGLFPPCKHSSGQGKPCPVASVDLHAFIPTIHVLQRKSERDYLSWLFWLFTCLYWEMPRILIQRISGCVLEGISRDDWHVSQWTEVAPSNRLGAWME
jgi:hypothetical protein